MRRLPIIVASVCLVAAVAFAALWLVPYETVASYGEVFRRRSDVTPERFGRWRFALAWFALNAAALGVLIGVCRDRVTRGLRAITTAASSGRSRLRWRSEYGWVVVITLVGAGLRLQRVAEPMAYDEAYSYLNFARQPLHMALGDYTSTNNHLLNTLCMFVESRLFGPQEWALRLHVLVAGIGLIPLAYAWAAAWRGRGAGLVVAALVAVSPALITYSADARGYMLVCVAALAFDGALGALSRWYRRMSVPEVATPSRTAVAGWWVVASAALMFGLCAMPIMVYVLLGSSAWFLVETLRDGRSRERLLRLVHWAVAVWCGSVGATVLYTPAYLLRGFAFLNDPIIRVGSDLGGTQGQLAVWWSAFEWWAPASWLEVPILILAGAGLALDIRRRGVEGRWWLPFVIVTAFNMARDIHPLPRILMFLAPWFYLPVATALTTVPRSEVWARRSAGVSVAVILLVFGVYDATQAVLINPDDRACYASVPGAVRAVAERQASEGAPKDESTVERRLYVPLPCDMPARFYLERAGLRIPVNEPPTAGGRCWLLTKPGQQPADVLRSPLLRPVTGSVAGSFGPWREVYTDGVVRVFEGRFPFASSIGNSSE